MSVPESALINRQRYLKDAKGSSFLDAVFLIHFYNRYAKWGGADIAPSEVFDPVDSAEYQLAVARVSRLFTQNSAVGMAHGARASQGGRYHLRRFGPGL